MSHPSYRPLPSSPLRASQETCPRSLVVVRSGSVSIFFHTGSLSVSLSLSLALSLSLSLSLLSLSLPLSLPAVRAPSQDTNTSPDIFEINCAAMKNHAPHPIDIWTCISVYMCIYMYVCVCVYVCVCMCDITTSLAISRSDPQPRATYFRAHGSELSRCAVTSPPRYSTQTAEPISQQGSKTWYGVATINSLLKIIGLFCRISSLL